ncbi:hypothetical protein U27_04419 [Candidatus Vecturithrix granuli]|uniref:Uncharacterized protein n=1 Tax=Vecturithrix granuli TaxID=1499967 RepID=A0A081BYP7_VECG1|nr:hypothetical protein U27_04419 [Candidatus Vecturithrix granuli]
MAVGSTLSLQSSHSQAETRQVLAEALQIEQAFAQARFLKFEQECSQFENTYQMDSEKFLQKFESGELGDEMQWFD